MRPERYASALGSRPHRRHADVKELHEEPETEKQNRGNLDDFKNDEQRDQRKYPRMGIEDEIRAEYPGDRATRADGGNRRQRIHVDVRERRPRCRT